MTAAVFAAAQPAPLRVRVQLTERWDLKRALSRHAFTLPRGAIPLPGSPAAAFAASAPGCQIGRYAYLCTMCNLYSQSRSRDEVRRWFSVSDNRAAKITPLDAIFPSHTAPIIRLTDDGTREIMKMSWGFVLPQAGKAPRRVTNVRDDKIMRSGFWRSSFEQRRCLVPASSYCEPNGETPATWQWFTLKADAPRPLFAFAGIWRHHEGPIKKDGLPVSIDVFAFMTTTPNKLTASINHERMPVLLAGEDQCDTWLNGSVEAAFALAKPFPADCMRIVQSGRDKRDLLAADY